MTLTLTLQEHRIAVRPQAGRKMLIEMPGYRVQGLITDRPGHQTPLEVWRSDNGRADIENRIKELG